MISVTDTFCKTVIISSVLGGVVSLSMHPISCTYSFIKRFIKFSWSLVQPQKFLSCQIHVTILFVFAGWSYSWNIAPYWWIYIYISERSNKTLLTCLSACTPAHHTSLSSFATLSSSCTTFLNAYVSLLITFSLYISLFEISMRTCKSH